jgi:hypothetical protein
MKTFASSLAHAQKAVVDLDTSDIESLAFVSGLVALSTVIPDVSTREIGVSVTIEPEGTLTVELAQVHLDATTREMINLVASHYFEARRRNQAVSVH